MVKTGDKVLITGSVRDETLMEHIAIETMKAGGQPMISLASDKLTRRSFDEVPASYDTLPPTLTSRSSIRSMFRSRWTSERRKTFY